MKILAIGDLHIGGSMNLGTVDKDTQVNTRLLDFSATLNWILDKGIEAGVKVLVLPGDCFETKIPTPSQLNIFSRFIQRAIEANIEVLITVGNHDQQRVINTTTIDVFNTLSLKGVKVFTDISSYTMADEFDEPVSFVFLPYRDRKMVGAETNEEAVKNISAKVGSVVAGLKGKKIAIGHFMVGAPVNGVGDGETFSISEVILPLEMFDGFDAVLMGHIHSHEILKPESPFIAYLGSMEKITFGDSTKDKVSMILDTNDLTHPEIIKSPVRQLHSLFFDYSGDELYKQGITDKIVADVEAYHSTTSLSQSIVKLTVKVKEDDLYHINQERIKRHIVDKGVRYLVPLQIQTITHRVMRNKEITETIDSKKAIEVFINGLSEPDDLKQRLINKAKAIIDDVEGK